MKAAGGGGSTWIVDGLFGIGLDRPLDAHWQKLIEAVNGANLPIVAVDVPSGLNAETGGVEGAAIKADITLTVGAPKRGLLKAAQWVGRLEVLSEAGLVPCPLESELNWTVKNDFFHLPPRRPAESNKGTFGHLAIYAGSFGYHGAAVLAGQGALRARPGWSRFFRRNLFMRPSPRNASRSWSTPGEAAWRCRNLAAPYCLAPDWPRRNCPTPSKRRCERIGARRRCQS